MKNPWSFLKGSELHVLSDLSFGNGFLTEDGRPGILITKYGDEEYRAIDIDTCDDMEHISKDMLVYKLHTWDGRQTLVSMLERRIQCYAQQSYTVQKEELFSWLFTLGFTYNQLFFVLEHCAEYGFSYTRTSGLYTFTLLEK